MQERTDVDVGDTIKAHRDSDGHAVDSEEENQPFLPTYGDDGTDVPQQLPESSHTQPRSQFTIGRFMLVSMLIIGVLGITHRLLFATTPAPPPDPITAPTVTHPMSSSSLHRLQHVRLDWLSAHRLTPFRQRLETELISSTTTTESLSLTSPTQSFNSTFDVRLVPLRDSIVRDWRQLQSNESEAEVQRMYQIASDHLRCHSPYNQTAAAYNRLDPAYLAFSHTFVPNPLFLIRSLLNLSLQESSMINNWRLVIYELAFEDDWTAPDSSIEEKNIPEVNLPRVIMAAQLLTPYHDDQGKVAELHRLAGLRCQVFEEDPTVDEQISAKDRYTYGESSEVRIFAGGDGFDIFLSCPLSRINTTRKWNLSFGFVRLFGPTLFASILLPYASVPTPAHDRVMCIRPLEEALKPSQAIQWLEYHLFLGIQHFYITDRTGAYEEVMRPFVDAGLASYHVWPAYHHKHLYDRMHLEHSCHLFSKRTASVAIYLDPDEYLTPMPCHFSPDALSTPCAFSSFQNRIAEQRDPNLSTKSNLSVLPLAASNCTSVLAEYWNELRSIGAGGVVFPNYNYIVPELAGHTQRWNRWMPSVNSSHLDGECTINEATRITVNADESSAAASTIWSISRFPNRKLHSYSVGKPSVFIRGTTKLSVHRTGHKLGPIIDPRDISHGDLSDAARTFMLETTCPARADHQQQLPPLRLQSSGQANSSQPGVDLSCSVPLSQSIRISHFQSLLHNRDSIILNDPRGGHSLTMRDVTPMEIITRTERWIDDSTSGPRQYAMHRLTPQQVTRIDAETAQLRLAPPPLPTRATQCQT